MTDYSRTIFFISDSTAITAETMGQSLLSQFDGIEFEEVTLPFIDSYKKSLHAYQQINLDAEVKGVKPIVFSTLIDPDIRKLIKSSNCLFFDLIETFIGRLESELHTESSHTIGRYHGRADEGVYDQRMHAVNYALSTDDGTATKYYGQADVILIGVSRTGKTPTCVYMGLQFGINAANYPLTEEDFKRNAIELPHLLNPFRDKLYGLTINPKRLQMIRSERRPDSRYSSLQQCQMELSKADMLFTAENIPHLNVTSMSVEEIASTILLECNLHRHVL